MSNIYLFILCMCMAIQSFSMKREHAEVNKDQNNKIIFTNKELDRAYTFGYHLTVNMIWQLQANNTNHIANEFFSPDTITFDNENPYLPDVMEFFKHPFARFNENICNIKELYYDCTYAKQDLNYDKIVHSTTFKIELFLPLDCSFPLENNSNVPHYTFLEFSIIGFLRLYQKACYRREINRNNKVSQKSFEPFFLTCKTLLKNDPKPVSRNKKYTAIDFFPKNFIEPKKGVRIGNYFQYNSPGNENSVKSEVVKYHLDIKEVR